MKRSKTKNKIKVVSFGGGSGQPVLLRALKQIPGLEITAIVNMFDNGGSTGRLCAELNVLPPGDVYRCITALAPDADIIAPFLARRLGGEGKLEGHTIGNLLMTQLEELSGDHLQAVRALSSLLSICGQVFPVTVEPAMLKAEYNDGHIENGEHGIDEAVGFSRQRRIERLYVEPYVRALPAVLQALGEADYIIAGPGDLHTSVLANAVVGGVAEAVRDSRGQFVYISNLMTKKGQTHGMGISDLLDEVEKYCLRRPDIVLINKARIPEAILSKYRRVGETVIKDDLEDRNVSTYREDILDETEVPKSRNDRLKRSFIKHSSRKLAEILPRIILR